MTIREQLRLAYYRSGLTHAEIAARAGVAENTVGRVLTGRNATVETLVAVAVVFGVESLTVAPR